MREFLAAALEVIAVLCLDGILDSRGNGVVGTENGTLDELDLTRHTTLEATSCGYGAARLLSLPSGLGRAGLAALVGRGSAVWSAKLMAWLVVALLGLALVGR